MDKIWANSGDSHLIEPADLFATHLPADLAERMPRSVKDDDGSYETIHVDGQSFRRRMPASGLHGRDRGVARSRRTRRRSASRRTRARRQRPDAAPGRPRRGGHLGAR